MFVISQSFAHDFLMKELSTKAQIRVMNVTSDIERKRFWSPERLYVLPTASFTGVIMEQQCSFAPPRGLNGLNESSRRDMLSSALEMEKPLRSIQYGHRSP